MTETTAAEKPTVKEQFPVTNLSCASCALQVEKTLLQQNGVVSASVNYANHMATVEYQPEQVDAIHLKTAVQAAGYDLMVFPKEDDAAQSPEEMLAATQQQYFLSLRKKVAGALILAIPLAIIGMFFMDWSYANYVMWLLSTPMIFYFGRQFFSGAWKQFKHRSANMDTLVAISTGTAYVFSVFNTLFPDFWHRRGIHPHVYFEAAGVVIAFILLGKLLEEKAKNNTGSAIKKLMGLQPKTVTVLLNGTQLTMPIQHVQMGYILLVKPGERIAVDGVVISGSSYVDESMISGEPVPVAKTPGIQVFAGTVNQKGSFRMEAQKVGGDTVLAHIIRMVQEAQGSKAPVQQLVDRVAAIFVPVVMVIALLSLVLWTVLGGTNGFSQGLIAFVTVLVIACPCALGLATPTAIMVGIGKGAEHGILIKDAESLEAARKITAVILDKTGTLTEGKPTVTNIRWIVPENEELRHILFSIEQASEHPLADAIVRFLQDTSIFLQDIAVENITGKGIKGEYDGHTYFIGNSALMRMANIHLPNEAQDWMDEQTAAAQTVVVFSDAKQVLALVSIADKLKSSAIPAVRYLKGKGIKVYMLTGDNGQAAAVVAKAVGADDFMANVLPSDKAAFTQKLQAAGEVVAMVGDGINDSHALAQADVSIAMGKGSDIAIEVAKMTILSADLQKIGQAIHLSDQTVITIRENLFWAFIYNIIGIPLAAGILYPVNGFLLDPMFAGAAMAFSSVSVVMNSLRLKWRKI